MIEPIAKEDFNLNGKFYFKGDKVNTSYDLIVKLNEKGYIEPLSLKQLTELKEKKEE